MSFSGKCPSTLILNKKKYVIYQFNRVQLGCLCQVHHLNIVPYTNGFRILA